MFFRKRFLPWTVSDQFDTEAGFHQWLQTRSKRFQDLRALCLVLASGLLIIGYVLDRRPIMLLTILPLALVLLFSAGLEQINRELDGQNKSD